MMRLDLIALGDRDDFSVRIEEQEEIPHSYVRHHFRVRLTIGHKQEIVLFLTPERLDYLTEQLNLRGANVDA